MIILRSLLFVVDSTSVKSVRCIGGKKRSYLGSVFPSVVRTSVSGSWKQGQKVKRILVRTKKVTKNKSGICTNFFHNGVVILTSKEKRLNPITTRVKGPLPYQLRFCGFSKVFALGAKPLLL